MKNKTFINAFSEIHPNEDKKEEILEKILNYKEKKTSLNRVYLKLSFSIVALLITIIYFPKKEIIIGPNLSRANLFIEEESSSFIYKGFVYEKSETTLYSNDNSNSTSIKSTESFNEELNYSDINSLLEGNFLGEYLFTIEDSSDPLFGAKIYKSSKDKNKLILFLNGIYEEYKIINNKE